MSGASAIATSKITNGSMIGQFGRAATRSRTQIILPLDLSPCDPSMKLGFVAPALRNVRKSRARFDDLQDAGTTRKLAATSISAVCGNMSSGVKGSSANLSCNSLKSRANVGVLHET